MKVPRGMYSTTGDGLGDPERATPEQVAHWSASEISAARDALASPSPVVRALRRVTEKSLGRTR